jgi:calcineurin-like phosphoesterase family protein
MMNVFVTADTHFSHEGICRFLNGDGSKLRPWDAVAEMDEEMVKRWNEVVRPTDKVYHLGDVVINRRALAILDRLNGDKVLIKGNHDIFKLTDYTKYFRDVRAYHVMDRMIFSHIPVHPDSKGRFKANVHGHTHANQIPDPWYVCVCVEHTDYKPIALEEIRSRFRWANEETFEVEQG